MVMACGRSVNIYVVMRKRKVRGQARIDIESKSRSKSGGSRVGFHDLSFRHVELAQRDAPNFNAVSRYILLPCILATHDLSAYLPVRICVSLHLFIRHGFD